MHEDGRGISKLFRARMPEENIVEEVEEVEEEEVGEEVINDTVGQIGKMYFYEGLSKSFEPRPLPIGNNSK